MSKLFDDTTSAFALIDYEGYRHNELQMQFAAAVCASIDDDGPPALCEADAGSGKTLAYALPLCLHAARAGVRVAIAVPTFVLARQLMAKDLATAVDLTENITGKRLRVAVKFGMGQFFSKGRIKQLDPVPKALLKFEGKISDYLEQYDALPLGLKPSQVCLTPSCAAEERAGYEAAAEAAEAADVVILTHALAILDARLWHNLLGANGGFDAVIVDEADRFPNAARSQMSVTVGLAKMQRIAKHLRADGTPAPTLEKAVAAADKWQRELHDRTAFLTIPEGRPAEDGQSVAELLFMSTVQLNEAVGHAMAMADAKVAPARIDVKEMVREARASLREFVRVARARPVWSETLLRWSATGSFSFVVRVDQPGRVASRMWHPRSDGGTMYRQTIFVSASLSTSTGPREFKASIGLKQEHPASCRIEHRAFGHASFVLADPAVPAPNSDDVVEGVADRDIWLDYTARGIEAAHRAGGRTLVLTTSYADTEALAKRIGDNRLIEHHRGERLDDVLRQYRAGDDALLITPTGWEGLDLPGLLDNLVITRLPFPALDLAQQLIEEALAVRRGWPLPSGLHYLRDRDRTARRLRQGIGRAPRAVDARVATWILDPRFVTSHPMVGAVPLRFRSGMHNALARAKTFTLRQQAA